MSGFDIGGAVNASADWVCNAPVVRSIVNNPVYTALLVTALAAVIAIALYGPQVKSAGARKGAKALIYMLLASLSVLFVHHYAVTQSASDMAAQKGVRDVFSSIEQSRESGIGHAVPVVPMGWGGVEGGAAAGDGAVAGGCGCPLAAGAISNVAGAGAGAGAGAPGNVAAARQGAARPDNLPRPNISLSEGVFIEDATLPSMAGHFGR